jgi:hypothetical protein
VAALKPCSFERLHPIISRSELRARTGRTSTTTPKWLTALLIDTGDVADPGQDKTVGADPPLGEKM